MLQYDLLYGKRYAYNSEDLYPASDLKMDVEDISISAVRKNASTNLMTVYGSNFTKNTKIFVNGTKVPTDFVTSSLITTSLDNVTDGDTITVNTLGSKNILLRAGTDEVTYVDPDVIHETEETEEPTQTTETTESTENTESTETNSTETNSSETRSSESTETKSTENTETKSSGATL